MVRFPQECDLLQAQATLEQIEGIDAPQHGLNSVPIRQLESDRVSPWLRAMPYLLGAGLVLASFLLVFVELAQPAPEPGFPGIRFSNTVGSPGSRAIVAMYREELDWLPRPFASSTLSPKAYVWGLRASLIAMLIFQIGAMWSCRRLKSSSPGEWIVGPVAASLVLLLYAPSCTDIFAYSSFGWVSDVGVNPYLRTPKSIGGDPYASFNDWTHIPTPYGPIWTGISRGVVHLAGHDPFLTAIGFKIVAALSAFGLAVVTYHLAKRFTEKAYLAVLAFIIVWWSPILIIESAATVHLDSLVMFLAMLGLAVATGTRYRSYRLGIALLVVSVLVKPVTLPLLGLLMLGRFTSPGRIGAVLRRVVIDTLMVAAMVAAAFAPFWSTSLPRAMYDNAKDLYADQALHSNPLWMWGLAHVDALIGFSDHFGGDTKSATRWIAIVLTILVTVLFIRTLRAHRRDAASLTSKENDRETFRFMILSWAAVTLVIGVLPVNAHPWYVIWSMAPLALLWISDGYRDRSRPPIWLIGLQAWMLLSFLIYHTLPRS